MNCKQAQTKIEIYLDSELTLSDQRDFEKHLDGCNKCKSILDNIRSLSESIQKIEYAKAPFSLQRKIKTDLKDVTGEDDAAYGRSQIFQFGAGCAVLTSIAAWAILTIIISTPIQNQIVRELTEAHVRSLMVDHVTDIVTSDSHTVKPWFSGKLDFSPTVKDLKSEGFTLIGGRLDYFDQRPAAALVYKRRSHYINVFIYRTDDSTQTSAFKDIQNQSYNLVNWKEQGLDYWVVSDLNKNELKQFAQLLGS